MSNELRTLLDERSAAPDADILHHQRLAGIRTKIRRRRARRRAVAGGLAVVFVLMIGYSAMPSLRERLHRPAPAATKDETPPALIEGFEKYSQGAHVVAAKSGQLPNRTVSFVVTPQTTALVYFERCSTSLDNVSLLADVKINGKPLSGGNCNGAGRLAHWTTMGVRVG